MKSRNKKSNRLEGLLFLILFVLLFFRCFVLKDGEADVAIVVVNFCGMIIAVLSLLIKIFSRIKKKAMRLIGAIICLVIIIVTVVMSFMLFFERLSFSNRINDCITIAALLFSLPSNWLSELLFGN